MKSLKFKTHKSFKLVEREGLVVETLEVLKELLLGNTKTWYSNLMFYWFSLDPNLARRTRKTPVFHLTPASSKYQALTELGKGNFGSMLLT